MNRVTLSDSQLQFFIDSQEAKIKSLEEKIETKSNATIAVMEYIKSLGKEHVLTCAKFIHEHISDPVDFVDATAYWHDSYVDLSPLNDLNPDGEEYFKSWTKEEKENEIK